MLFEITGDDIARLGDEDLRTLIGRLCEAELSRKGFSKAAVTYGGNQTASDGGIDVRVELGASIAIDGFIPRPNVGLQAKISNMPPQAILDEMRPNGVLRPAITELAEQGGAYVIVSSNGSVSDTALKLRKSAMRRAIGDCPQAARLFVDFYDRGRLATWVREFPALENWVRVRIGRPLKGWRFVENWSNPTEAETAEYIIDDTARIFDGRASKEDAIPVVEAVNRMRRALEEPKAALRLVGLSGLGKTRLLQALFDKRVGEAPLDPNYAIYTDIADQPEPSVREMASELIRQGTRGILLVDNCPPDTHQAVVEICARSGSNISAITVEYDVRDDSAEGSRFFRLEPASDDVIELLIERRYPDVSAPARGRLAEFAGGNARVAIALAQTVGKNETLGDLTDEQLFVRLFNQRKPEDAGLLQSAEAISLVYSFDGETFDGTDAELPILAKLADVSVEVLHRHIAELRRRNLVQSRSRWRALLPHALANRLAKRAFENLPTVTIETAIQHAPARMLKSFSRRVGYLHNSEAAVRLATRWLGDGGYIGDVTKLNATGVDLLYNISPAAPTTALGAIERGLTKPNGSSLISASPSGRSGWAALLRSLAYEPAHFSRAAAALAKLAIAEGSETPANSFRSNFGGLFHLYLSGTNANPQQKLDFLRGLVFAPSDAEQRLGLDALDQMLEATHFGSVHAPDFGARPRDHGWHPGTWEEVRAWYASALSLVRDLIVGDGPLAAKVKGLLAKNLRSLIHNSPAFDEVEALVNEIAALGEWPEGWIALKESLKYRTENMPPAMTARLRSLERNLSPTAAVATVRAYIFSNRWGVLEEDDDDDDEDGGNGNRAVSRFQRSSDRKVELVRDLAASDETALRALLDQAVSTRDGALVEFGEGIALGLGDPALGWSMIRDAYSKYPKESRHDSVACGFTRGVAKRFGKAAAHDLLDKAIDDEVFGEMYPRMQLLAGVDERDSLRILESVKLGRAPTWQYQYFELGRISDNIPSNILRKILLELMQRENGPPISVNILGMRYHSGLDSKGKPLDNTLLETGRELLMMYPFQNQGSMESHHLAQIAEVCLDGPEHKESARAICLHYRDALADYGSSAYMAEEFAAALFKVQPLTAMDELLLNGDPEGSFCPRNDFTSSRIGPFDNISDDTIIEWTSIDPSVRVPIIGRYIAYDRFVANGELSPIGSQLLAMALDKVRFLDGIRYLFWPTSWSGSLADHLTPKISVLLTLKSHHDAAVREWATEMESRLLERIERYRSRERIADESFE